MIAGFRCISLFEITARGSRIFPTIIPLVAPNTRTVRLWSSVVEMRRHPLTAPMPRIEKLMTTLGTVAIFAASIPVREPQVTAPNCLPSKLIVAPLSGGHSRPRVTCIAVSATARWVSLSSAKHPRVPSSSPPDVPISSPPLRTFESHAPPTIRVGVAYDPAFCFYYQDNLELLEAEGAELVRFSPLRDQALPAIDLLYLGGGYPELYGEALTANASMRRAIRTFAEQGGAIYAECGGLMYLTRSIRDFDGRSYDMVGLFPAEAVMKRPGLTLGYRQLELTHACLLGAVGLIARGHEFHYSSLNVIGPLDHACRVIDAKGQLRGKDGLMTGNTLALYSHLHFASQPEVPRALIRSARNAASRRREKQGETP